MIKELYVHNDRSNIMGKSIENTIPLKRKKNKFKFGQHTKVN